MSLQEICDIALWWSLIKPIMNSHNVRFCIKVASSKHGILPISQNALVVGKSLNTNVFSFVVFSAFLKLKIHFYLAWHNIVPWLWRNCCRRRRERKNYQRFSRRVKGIKCYSQDLPLTNLHGNFDTLHTSMMST